jgi:hypothetical protein
MRRHGVCVCIGAYAWCLGRRHSLCLYTHTQPVSVYASMGRMCATHTQTPWRRSRWDGGSSCVCIGGTAAFNVCASVGQSLTGWLFMCVLYVRACGGSFHEARGVSRPRLGRRLLRGAWAASQPLRVQGVYAAPRGGPDSGPGGPWRRLWSLVAATVDYIHTVYIHTVYTVQSRLYTYSPDYRHGAERRLWSIVLRSGLARL